MCQPANIRRLLLVLFAREDRRESPIDGTARALGWVRQGGSHSSSLGKPWVQGIVNIAHRLADAIGYSTSRVQLDGVLFILFIGQPRSCGLLLRAVRERWYELQRQRRRLRCRWNPIGTDCEIRVQKYWNVMYNVVDSANICLCKYFLSMFHIYRAFKSTDIRRTNTSLCTNEITK